MHLLSVSSDSKTVKGEQYGYLTGILYMIPDLELCPFSLSAQCSVECLNFAGRGAMDSVQKGRKRKTDLYRENPELFFGQVVDDIKTLVRQALSKDMTPVVRLNGTSDIPYERIPVTVDGVTYPNIMAVFPTVQFMDYTKIVARFKRPLPSNYDLTFSYSGAPAFRVSVLKAVAYGARIAVVFDGAQPAEFMGMPVIDGDDSDLRFLDPQKTIVGLKAKGKARNSDSPFVVRIPTLQVA